MHDVAKEINNQRLMEMWQMEQVVCGKILKMQFLLRWLLAL